MVVEREFKAVVTRLFGGLLQSCLINEFEYTEEKSTLKLVMTMRRGGGSVRSFIVTLSSSKIGEVDVVCKDSKNIVTKANGIGLQQLEQCLTGFYNYVGKQMNQYGGVTILTNKALANTYQHVLHSALNNALHVQSFKSKPYLESAKMVLVTADYSREFLVEAGLRDDMSRISVPGTSTDEYLNLNRGLPQTLATLNNFFYQAL